MNKKLLALCVALAVAVLFPACGKSVLKTEPVTGTITLDGAPLANCIVYFTPTGEGAQGVGRTDAQGVYKLQTAQGAADAGTTPGSYKVHFTCDEIVSPEETDAEGNTIKEEVVKSVIPAKYNNAETSGCTAEVVKGKNTIDFALESK